MDLYNSVYRISSVGVEVNPLQSPFLGPLSCRQMNQKGHKKSCLASVHRYCFRVVDQSRLVTATVCMQEFSVPPVPEVVNDSSAAGQLALRNQGQTRSAAAEYSLKASMPGDFQENAVPQRDGVALHPRLAQEQSWQALPAADSLNELRPVSYTHLTLPTNREV